MSAARTWDSSEELSVLNDGAHAYLSQAVLAHLAIVFGDGFQLFE
jgi:hypothetical protein